MWSPNNSLQTGFLYITCALCGPFLPRQGYCVFRFIIEYNSLKDFVGLSYQGKDIVFRFIIEYISLKDFVGLSYQGKDIVFRFIIEYSSLKDFGPQVIGLF